MYPNYVICEQVQFYFFHSNPCAFFPPCLITLSKTTSTTLNKSGKSEHTCFVLDLRGKL